MQAQLFVYLLAVLSRCALNIVSVSPTYKPQTLTAMSRLEKVLSRNLFNHRVDLVPMDGLNLLSASMCFRISRKSMRPEKLYLTDIVEACKAIEVFCEGVTFN